MGNLAPNRVVNDQNDDDVVNANNSVFRGFFEKQKLTGPNFINWYRQLRIVLSIEDKLNYLEQPIPPAPVAPAGQQEEGQSVRSYVHKMKGYIDNLERLGHPVTLGLGVSMILIGLRKEYDGFVQNYNMHNMGKTVNELHAMLKLHEKTLPKNNAPALNAIRADKVQKGNKHKKSQSQLAARGHNHRKRKNKQAYAPKLKIPPPPKKEDPAKDSICHECGETGHWKRNCPQYLVELLKKKKNAASGAGGLDTSINYEEDDLEIDEPQSDIVPIRRSTRTRHAPDRMCLYIDAEENELGDLGEPANYKAALLDPEILIATAAYYVYEIWQMDVKTTFLNGYLNEEVYMEQPEGFVNLKYPNRKFGFTQNRDEACVYLNVSGSNITFLILYIDDILIMGNNIPMLQSVKTYLGRCFSMKDLGEASYILGIKIYRDRSRQLIGLCQSAYIEKILKRFCMENSKRKSIPMQEKLKLSKSQGASTPAELKRMQNVPYALAVGSIMYAVRKFISGLGVVPIIEEPISMYCDNTGAIAIANEFGITKGARHFRAKVHYLQEVIKYGDNDDDVVNDHNDDGLNEDDFYMQKIQELVNEKMKQFTREDQERYELKFKKNNKLAKKVIPTEVVSNEVIQRLKEFITNEMNGSDMQLVIQKVLFTSDVSRCQNRLNMPYKKLETHNFLTDDESRVADDEEGVKTNWSNFVDANKADLKARTKIQIPRVGVGLAEIDVSILLTSASTPIISSELVDTPRMSSNLFVSDRMLSKDVGTGELAVGMGDSTVSVSICSAEVSTAFRNLRAAFFIRLTSSRFQESIMSPARRPNEEKLSSSFY
nr:putative retrotransposon protein [Tanacetum cinerariifolium]